jgi:hypothetical protein
MLHTLGIRESLELRVVQQKVWMYERWGEDIVNIWWWGSDGLCIYSLRSRCAGLHTADSEMAIWSRITQLRTNFPNKERWRSWVYANDIDSAERGVPLETVEMQVGVRNRNPAQARGTVVGQEDEIGEASPVTSSTGGTLTPTDADEELQTQRRSFFP